MASTKKKAKAKTVAKFKDLKSKRNPKGGAFTNFIKFGPTAKLAQWID